MAAAFIFDSIPSQFNPAMDHDMGVSMSIQGPDSVDNLNTGNLNTTWTA